MSFRLQQQIRLYATFQRFSLLRHEVEDHFQRHVFRLAGGGWLETWLGIVDDKALGDKADPGDIGGQVIVKTREFAGIGNDALLTIVFKMRSGFASFVIARLIAVIVIVKLGLIVASLAGAPSQR